MSEDKSIKTFKLAVSVMMAGLCVAFMYLGFYLGTQTGITACSHKTVSAERREAFKTLSQAIWSIDRLDDTRQYCLTANETHALLYVSPENKIRWKCIAVFQFVNNSYVLIQLNNMSEE